MSRFIYPEDVAAPTPPKSPQTRIDDALDRAYAALKEATTIADEHEIEFEFSIGYGMGGTYYPVRMTRAKAISMIESGSDLTTEVRAKLVAVLRDEWDSSNSNEIGWVSSSSQC